MGNTSVLPPLAKQARIRGDVVIDKTGSVVEMKGVSPRRLSQPRWPRFARGDLSLDDEPIDIQFIWTVRFELQN